MSRFEITAGILAGSFVACFGILLQRQSDAQREEEPPVTVSVLQDKWANPPPQLPPPVPAPPDRWKAKREANQEAIQSVRNAWDIYWAGNLANAMAILREGRERNRSEYYPNKYFDGLIAALPEYDTRLRELKLKKMNSSGAEREAATLEIYHLSKQFYAEHGMEGEISIRHGLEFYEAETELLWKNEEVTRGRLISNLTNEGSSCDDGPPETPIGELTEFLKKFPNSPQRKEFEGYLEEYRSGRASCNSQHTAAQREP